MQLQTFFACVGVAVSGIAVTRLLQELFIFVRPSSLSRYLSRDEHSGESSWAFVSGASDGIGLGFAHELCKRGFNVFLHGRNREKLKRVQDELRQLFPMRTTEIVVYDASQITAAIDDEILSAVGEAPLTVLVNNVGGMAMIQPSPYVNLQDFSFAEMQAVLDVNANFTAHLTRILLPRLLRSQPSLVMNISSIAKLGFPWLVPYAATKAFVLGFGDGLSAEMRADQHDVDVLGVIVGSVSTAALQVPESFFVPSAQAMASAALDRVGCGRLSVWGYWTHRLRGFTLDLMSHKTIQMAATRELRKLRRDALEQAQQKNKEL